MRTTPGSLSSQASQPSSIDYRTFEKADKIQRMSHDHHESGHVGHSHQPNNTNSSPVGNGRKIALRDFFTVLALSFHAVFEGLAVGLESDAAAIWTLFGGNFSDILNIKQRVKVISVINKVALKSSSASSFSYYIDLICSRCNSQIRHFILCWP